MEIINTGVEWALFFAIVSSVLMTVVYLVVGIGALVVSSRITKKRRELERKAYGPAKDAVLCVKSLVDNNAIPERRHTFIEPVVESQLRMLERNLEAVEREL